MKPKEEGEIRWLHISDLHYMANPRDEFFRNSFLGPRIEADEGVEDEYDVEVLRRSGLHGLIKKAQVDCIVVTGDFFNRGHWEDADVNRMQQFLEELYSACSMASGWGWQVGQPMNRLFFCPGNHDFSREAGVMVGDRAFTLRKSEVRSVADASLNEGHANLGLNRSLFVDATFEQFADAINTITAQDEPYYKTTAAESFIIDAPREGCSDIVFMGLNTAILAGQPDDMQVAQRDLLTHYIDMRALFTENAILVSNDNTRVEELIDLSKKFSVARRRVNNELVVDEKRLSLPPLEDITRIERTIQNRPQPIVIVFGHHPIEYLSPAAQDCLHNMMWRWGSSLYLCGHAHRPNGHFMKAAEHDYLVPNYEATSYQIAVGGFFPDDGGYSQTSFCIGSVKQHQGNPRTYSYRLYLYVFLENALADGGDWLTSTYLIDGLRYPHLRQPPIVQDLADDGDRRDGTRVVAPDGSWHSERNDDNTMKRKKYAETDRDADWYLIDFYPNGNRDHKNQFN